MIASACVVNNYIDREIDSLMQRTQKRALVSGEINANQAVIFAVVLGLSGFAALAYYANWLTFAVGAVAYIFYVAIYGIAKRRSVHGTLVGSVAGALPPVAGYTAVTNNLDLAAAVLFVILVCWQMPHFYAIAVYRYRDYKAAKLPVISVKLGISQARRLILAYIVAFLLTSALLAVFGYTGYIYLFVMSVTGVLWFKQAMPRPSDGHSALWANQLFVSSLYVILALDIMLALGPILP